MKKYLLNLALLFIATGAAAQANYQSGYVITNSNDTIRGFIDNRDKTYIMKNVDLKKNQQDKKTTRYTPADVKKVNIPPYYNFISYLGRLSNNKNSYPDIDLIQDTTTTYQQVFLQLLASGPNAELYMNSDEIKTRYFIKEKTSAPVELIYYEFTEGNKARHISTFAGQLIAIYGKYNAFDDKKINALQNTEFSHGGLERALVMINNNVTYRKEAPSFVRLFIGALGVSSTSSVDKIFGTGSKSESTTFAPKISIGADLLTNPVTSKLIFRGEVAFTYIKPNYTFSYTPDGIHTIEDNKYAFSRYTLSLMPQIIYNVYNKEDFKFFLGAGVSTDYSFIQGNAINFHYIKSLVPSYTLGDKSMDGNKITSFATTFLLTAGVVLNKHFELSIVYTPAIALVSTGDFKLQSIAGGFHYLF